MSYDVHVAENPTNLEQNYWAAYLASLHPIVAHPDSYYRSQLYTEKTGINPLVKAAAPLLSLLGQLNNQQLLINEEFFPYLEHEFKAFITQSSQQNYDKEVLQMAYHMLRSAFFEAEQHTDEDVIEVKATSSQTQLDFFTLYEQLRETLALELLELGYLLISLGYRGKYRNVADGKNQLDSLSKHLYEYIREQRGEFSKTLSINEKPSKIQLITKPNLATHFKLGLVTLAGTMILLYCSFNLVLDLSTAPTYKELQQLQQTLTNNSTLFSAGAN